MSKQATRTQAAARTGSAPSLMRTLAGASFLLVGIAIGNWPTKALAQSTLSAAGTRSVAGFESVGLYWSAPGVN